jgi:two-component system, chemotaxis family, protein-glutamate methylesterase/glutaminase
LLVGCSAGGFNLVFDLILRLPKDFSMSVVIVIHRGRKYKSSIEALLNSKAKVTVKIPDDKEVMEKGHVYFAPSDYHLLLEPEGLFTLDYSEPVLFCRPSIDITFQSVADVWGEKVVAILLSGANSDGADGISYVKRNKGIVVVQDPECAEVRTMPEAAISRCQADFILKDDEIFEFIDQVSQIKKPVYKLI